MEGPTSKESEQDPAQKDEQVPLPELPGTPQGVPGISPPGMKLRSARKKRRRSTDTCTDDDEGEKPPHKRRAVTRKSSSKRKKKAMDVPSNDETMTDAQDETEDDQTVGDSKTEPFNGHKPKPLPTVVETHEETHEGTAVTVATTTTATVAAPANGTKPGLEPISKLRMSSKPTPGKLETMVPTHSASEGHVESRCLQFGRPTNVLNEPPRVVPAASQASSQPPVASPEGIPNAELTSILTEGTRAQQKETVEEGFFSWHQSLSTSIVSVMYSIREVVVNIIVPQKEEYAEGEEEEIQVTLQSSPILTRSNMWFIILLLFQLLCWNSIWTTVQETSERSLGFYKSMFATNATTIDSSNIEKAVLEAPPVVELDAIDKKHLEEIKTLRRLLEPFNKGTGLESHVEFTEKKLREIRGRMRERRVSLGDWLGGLRDVESALKNLAAAESIDKVPALSLRANEMLGFFKDMVPPEISIELLDLQYVFLWKPLSSECFETDAPASENAVLTPAQLETGEEQLRQLAHSSASELMADERVSSALRSWVRGVLLQNAALSSETERTLSVGLSKTGAREVIANVLEVQQADQTGIRDYASVLMGASVILLGERATSPSLVDSLPLWNRLMQQAHLRFYGYGPEAALTPTFPTDALGQCWAFDNASKQKSNTNDYSYGRYATLTVRLSQPIYVISVTIEHAPKELTDQLQSAIKEFRILGYEDADGAGRPWHLGSFQYDIGK